MISLACSLLVENRRGELCWMLLQLEFAIPKLYDHHVRSLDGKICVVLYFLDRQEDSVSHQSSVCKNLAISRYSNLRVPPLNVTSS